jgi:LTXXQ motif family protein
MGETEGRRDRRKVSVSALEALRSWRYAKAQPTVAVRRVQSGSAVTPMLKAGACIATTLLLIVPLLTLEADARGGGGGGGHGGGGGGHGGAAHGGGFGGHGAGFGGHRGGGAMHSFSAAHIGRARTGGAHIAANSVRGSRFAGRSARIHGARVGGRSVAARAVGGSRSQARLGGATASARALGATGARTRDPAPRVFGNRAIANVALRSQFGAARFHGGFLGSAWPWWWGGLVTGWVGPLFWPYAYYDFFDYVFWPYAYDDFWPYAYDDVYYGIYGPYAYNAPYAYNRRYADPNGPYASMSGRRGVTSGRYAALAKGTEHRAAEVCSDDAAQLTDWPIERISEVVEPTDAQRPAFEELRAASAKAIDMLKSGCPKDLPSIPTGRLAAMESRLQVMLAAVQTVRPALERFYQSLSDEQKARFNAIAPVGDADAAAKDQRDLTRFCDEKAPGVTDLPIDRIAQAVQPTPAQRAALDELKDASVKAAEGFKVNCPTYQTLTPTGRVEAMEKRLDATLAAVKTVQPALAKFYNSLSDEQKARFNSLRSASRPVG